MAEAPGVKMETNSGVILDLSEIVFLDSAGLGLLIRMHQLFPEATAVVVVVALGSQPDRVLRLAHLEHLASIIRND